MAIVNVSNFCSIIIVITFCVFQNNRVNGMECGRVNLTRPVVESGNVILRNEWPFIAALYEKRPTEFFCGGTVISSRHVLTAAHCIHRKDSLVKLSPEDVEVRLGAHNLTAHNDTEMVQRNVSAIHVHPDWKADNTSYDADLAILVLSAKVNFSNFIHPICMPASDIVVDGAMVDVKGTVVGWGLAANEDHEEIPRQTVLKAVNNMRCYRDDPVIINSTSHRSFCAKGIDGTPTKGDSGGGFFVVSKTVWVQYGIVSALHTKSGHATIDSYSIYTNVKSFKPWIVEKITQTGDEVGEVTMKVNLTCQYYAHKVVPTGYTCHLYDLEMRTEHNEINFVFGLHDFGKEFDDVTTIDFTNGHMFALPEGLGKFFKNVKLLCIGRANLTMGLQYIGRSSLKSLGSLEHIYVFDNNIEELDKDCFWDLPNLKTFSFVNSKIKALHENTFERNEKLLRVYLIKNKLEILPKNLFKRNTLLEYIYLDENSIEKIDENIFETNCNLTIINLSSNQFEFFPRYLFKNNLLLRRVYLSNNSLKALDENIFETNSKLTIINLSSNQLDFVPRYLFRNNSMLEFVYLRDNSLTALDDDIFEKNVKLSFIALSSNQLESLPKNIFQNNFLLASLQLGNNFLKTIRHGLEKICQF